MSHRVRPPLALALALAFTCGPSRALCQALEAEPVRDRAVATELWNRARALMADGKPAQACPLLEESERLDPAGGTLLNLALCHEQLGRTATAWAEFNDALALARRDGRTERIRFAEEHIAALGPRLSRLTVEVAPSARVPELVVSVDGEALGATVYGLALPIDPGDHQVRAQLPGYAAFEQRVAVGPDADQQTVTVPALMPDAARASAADTAPHPAPQAGGATTPQRAPRERAPARTGAAASEPPPRPAVASWLGWSALAAGGVGLAIGAVAGVRAFDLHADAQSACASSDCGPDSRARRLDGDAGGAADISTVAFAAGGALAVTGALLLLVWNEPSEPPPAVALGPGGLRAAF